MRTTNRGFTLIEAMIATVVLAVCVAGMSTALVASSQQTGFAAAEHRLFDAARLAMESLASQHLSALSPASGHTTSEVLEAQQPSDPAVSVEATLTYLNRSTGQGARDLALVTVTATDTSGRRVVLHRVVTRAEGSR